MTDFPGIDHYLIFYGCSKVLKTKKRKQKTKVALPMKSKVDITMRLIKLKTSHKPRSRCKQNGVKM